MMGAAPGHGLRWSGTGNRAGSRAASLAPQAQTDESLAQVQAALAASSGGMQVANPFSSAGQANFTVEQLRAWLRQNGLEAQAHIDKLEDTGQTVGDEHLFKLEIDSATSPASRHRSCPPLQRWCPWRLRHKLFQGMTVPVRTPPRTTTS